jgi:hypothetical protein
VKWKRARSIVVKIYPYKLFSNVDMNGTPLFLQLGEDVALEGCNMFGFSFVYFSTRVQGMYLKEFTQ